MSNKDETAIVIMRAFEAVNNLQELLKREQGHISPELERALTELQILQGRLVNV